jgi:hypothetical protein
MKTSSKCRRVLRDTMLPGAMLSMRLVLVNPTSQPVGVCAVRGNAYPHGWYYFKTSMQLTMWWMKWMTVGGQGPEAIACCGASILGR